MLLPQSLVYFQCRACVAVKKVACDRVGVWTGDRTWNLHLYPIDCIDDNH